MIAGALIRTAGPPDAPAIATIFAPYVTGSVASFHEDPPSPAEWEARMGEAARAGHPCLAAETDGRVIGFAVAGPFRPKPAYRRTVEVTVYVEEGSTGRGIGRALLDELVGRCSAGGFEQMMAVVTVGVEPSSARFFEAAGFEQVGLLPGVGFKYGRHLDIGLYQRSLRPEGEA